MHHITIIPGPLPTASGVADHDKRNGGYWLVLWSYRDQTWPGMAWARMVGTDRDGRERWSEDTRYLLGAPSSNGARIIGAIPVVTADAP
jgi:hypothetical protein